MAATTSKVYHGRLNPVPKESPANDRRSIYNSAGYIASRFRRSL